MPLLFLPSLWPPYLSRGLTRRLPPRISRDIAQALSRRNVRRIRCVHRHLALVDRTRSPGHPSRTFVATALTYDTCVMRTFDDRPVFQSVTRYLTSYLTHGRPSRTATAESGCSPRRSLTVSAAHGTSLPCCRAPDAVPPAAGESWVDHPRESVVTLSAPCVRSPPPHRDGIPDEPLGVVLFTRQALRHAPARDRRSTLQVAG